MSLRVVCCLLLSLFSLAAVAGPPPAPEALAIIERLQLRAASERMDSHANWAPKRVIVSAPPLFTQLVPDFAERLRAAAPGIELDIDQSGQWVPSKEQLTGADALIGLCIPQTIAQVDSNFLWLHSYFVGMDRCATLTDAQITNRVFTNGKRLSGPTIAEHAIAMMFAISRGLPAYQRAQAEHTWARDVADDVRFGELEGKTLLVVGLGGIGTEVARRAHGVGMRVIATRNSSRNGPDFVDYVGLSDELHKLAGEAHVIVNALPLTEKTTGLFDAEFFAAARKGAMFLSVGRGKSTVTTDLVAALESGQLYGAGLDVTDPEPLPADSPLWDMPNVIITPHTSAAGADSLRRGATIAIENLRRYVAGEPLLNVVNMQAGY